MNRTDNRTYLTTIDAFAGRCGGRWSSSGPWVCLLCAPLALVLYERRCYSGVPRTGAKLLILLTRFDSVRNQLNSLYRLLTGGLLVHPEEPPSKTVSINDSQDKTNRSTELLQRKLWSERLLAPPG